MTSGEYHDTIEANLHMRDDLVNSYEDYYNARILYSHLHNQDSSGLKTTLEHVCGSVQCFVKSII